MISGGFIQNFINFSYLLSIFQDPEKNEKIKMLKF